MQHRSYLLVAVGVAAGVAIGIAIASFSERPAAAPPQPLVEVRGGHVEGGGELRVLHPQSIRVGDQITRLGPTTPATPDRALVYLDVNGVPVLISMVVGPNPGVLTPPSDFPPRPIPDGQVMQEAIQRVGRSTHLGPAVLLSDMG